MNENYVAFIESWRRSMDERLRARNGWLAVAGLFWLHDGLNRFGADSTGEVVLPDGTAPAAAGTIELDGGRATLRLTSPIPLLVDGQPVEKIELRPDTSGETTFVDLGDLRLALLQRGSHFAIRLWDNRRRQRVEFPPRRWFPIDTGWIVEASFTPHPSGIRIRVPNELGRVTEEESPGALTFHLAGHDAGLEALEGDEGGLFLVFADASNGRTTYPSGRFLKTEPPNHGRVILDFNRAYNPPCAFTPFATCPLPPAQNRLPVSVEAGERYPVSK